MWYNRNIARLGRGRATENIKWKNALLLRRFDFQYLGLNECEACGEPTPAPADVIVLLVLAIARGVQIHQFHLGTTAAVGTVDARVIHLLLPLLDDLPCCFHSLSPLFIFCLL